MKTQTTIRNCDKAFRFVCPQNWVDLSDTSDNSQRFCDKCEQIVYLCVSDKETLEHARAGHCIAREIPNLSGLPELVLGRPKVIHKPTESELEVIKLVQREAGIDDSLANINAQRCCPKCDFPAPNWRETCRVCGCEFGHVPHAKKE